MRRQATRRNAAAVRQGRVEPRVGTVADLVGACPGVEPFDKAYAVDVFLFWPDPVPVLRHIAQLLRPGGVMALTLQPRGRYLAAGARAAGEQMAAAMGEAGFADVRVELLALPPVDVACAVGVKP